MPLIDAYIKCDNIEGSHKPASSGAGSSASKAKLELEHTGWSEIYSFSYSLSAGNPTLTITKPVDNASNDLYVLFLKNRSRDIQKGKGNADPVIQEIQLELCRWVDINNDGIVDEFQVFIEYTFKRCRVNSYNSTIDFAADDLPSETIVFSFHEMTMKFYHPDECTQFAWDFAKAQPVGK